MNADATPAFPGFQAIFEASPSPYAILAPDAPRFTILGANAAFLQIAGTDREAILGQGLFDVFPDNPDAPGANSVLNLRASLERVIARREPHRMADQRYDIRSDGPASPFVERHWRPSNTPVFAPDGRIAAILHHVEDVTDDVVGRRAAVVALRETRSHAHEVLEGMTEAYMLLDRDFRVVEVNRATVRMDGRPREELVGRTHWELWPANVGTVAEAFYRRAMDSREPESMEHHYQGGNIDLWLEISAQPTHDGGLALFYRDIAARKHTEIALAESEERFRNMADHAPVMMWVADPQGNCVYLNERWYEFTGQSAGEAEGDGWLLAVHPEDRGRAASVFAAANVDHGHLQIEYRLRRHDGTHRWALDTASPRFGMDGEFLGYVGSVIDIDERRETEERLRTSEGRLRALNNLIPSIIWFATPDGNLQYLNRRWYDYSGLTPEESLPNGWFAAVHPDDRARTAAAWSETLARGTPYEIETRFRRRDGAYRWFFVRAEPVRDGDGNVTGWFGNSSDITDIVEARELLATSRQELEREVAARTAERDRIWRHSNELMGVFGYDGMRRSINPAWTRVLGHDEQTLLETPVMDITHPDDRPRLAEAIARLRRGEPVPEFLDRVRHADGSYRTIAWTGVPGDDVFYAIGRDVTEYRKAEEALRQAQKMEAVGQLTGGVAHDFNNLLTIIRSSTDLLRRPDLPEERRRRYVDAITDTVERASKLTGQLLAFARRQALKPEVFDVPERVRAINDMLRTIVGGRIRIATEITCDRCFAEADVTQFETALVNMAVNARDAMDGEGTLTVRVRCIPHLPAIRGHGGGHGSFIAVSLRDTGCGIEQGKLVQIFEPFFTTKEVGKGTGLGLSQVYGFAKQSGGDVEVESEVGRGATFTLYLPLVDKEASRGPAPEAEDAREDGQGRCVLVVEDNVEVGRFSTQVLQDMGYETTWASNAAQALEMLADHHARFDAVFSDVVMPGMSGIELGQEIRRRHPGLPVVLTSGYSHVLAEEGRHGFELLQKPYAAENLSRVLRRVTGTRRRTE